MVVQVLGKAFQAAGAAVKTSLQATGAALQQSLSRAILPVARYAPLQSAQQALNTVSKRAAAGASYAGNLAGASMPVMQPILNAAAAQPSAFGQVLQGLHRESFAKLDQRLSPFPKKGLFSKKGKAGGYNAALGYNTKA